MNKKEWGYIYKITSPNGKIYIGSTNDFKARTLHYKNLHCKGQIKLYNSLLKYGYINHKIEIIWVCKLEELLFQEFTFGKLYDVLDNKKGLNLKLPKINDSYKSMTDETRQKIKDSLKDIWTKYNHPMKGKSHTEESKLKMSKAGKGRKRSIEIKLKIKENNFNAKKVICTITGKIFHSTADAGLYIDMDSSTLSKRLRGKMKNKTGLKYLDE